jgi:hypothetical protein
MNEREQFEKWYQSVRLVKANFLKLPNSGVYMDAGVDESFDTWQAATAQHQETINSLLAVIAKKDEALSSVIESCEDARLSVNNPEAYVRFGGIQSLAEDAVDALTPEKVRLVEVAYMSANEDCTDCIVWHKDDEHTTALYTIEVNESITIPDPTLPNVNLHTMGRAK